MIRMIFCAIHLWLKNPGNLNRDGKKISNRLKESVVGTSAQVLPPVSRVSFVRLSVLHS